ncbi:MAG: DNA-processing protein DprA [Pseudomonadota bacterium]
MSAKPPTSSTQAPKSGSGIPFSRQQKIDWLRLIRSENVGPRTFYDLIDNFQTASNAMAALPELAKRGGRRSRIKVCSLEDAETELQTLEQRGGSMICRGEPAYPATLRSIDDAPPILSVMGNPDILCEPQVAFVGARNASLAGIKFTGHLAEEVAAAGYAITSGLARGIDTAAHKAGLETGTVAVFAGGLNVTYPPENGPLVEAIIEKGGAIIAEMPLAWQPRAQDFPRRNRIVAGLAHGLVVIEAARRSGSLISARLANEYGRTVFAVPGSPLDPRSEGTNLLIQQGATLITSAQDILDAIAPSMGEEFQGSYSLLEDESDVFEAKAEPQQSDRERFISALDHTPMDLDELMRFAQLDPATTHIILIELQLAGRIERHSGNKVSLI